jgi:hypothetical protein
MEAGRGLGPRGRYKRWAAWPARRLPHPTMADDPFEAVLRPPTDESEDARARRLVQEAEALRVSQAIDESLRQERTRNKKKAPVRVLLLGQSESGAYAMCVCVQCADLTHCTRSSGKSTVLRRASSGSHAAARRSRAADRHRRTQSSSGCTRRTRSGRSARCGGA